MIKEQGEKKKAEEKNYEYKARKLRTLLKIKSRMRH